MDDHEARALVAAFDTKDNAARGAAWEKLRPLGERVLPFFEEFLPSARRLEARRNIAFHSIRFARTNDAAFRIGLATIRDRSSIVRYRGCCVLAYSLRRDALPHLRELLAHADSKTAEDAKAAVDAIENQNHHYFMDRGHSNRSFWHVTDADRDASEKTARPQ